MKISEQKIEEIRASANIVDIISESVQLRKRGKNFIGLCPFHSEKTPSFTVSEEKQLYHCFGCHSGGNVFKFLMEYEKISFVESVQQLAEKLGIQLEIEKNANPEFQNEQEILYDINTEAAKYFLNNLLNDSEGQIARDYFQKRNIKLPTMRAFGLGYALNGWENLVNFLHQKKIDLEKALQLGLISRSKDGRIYDTLPGRIIFPIFSPNGRVVAFAGRKIHDSTGGGKYINSPETAIYVKGKILYGLSHAKDDIRKLNKAILVEGYMDLISLYQNGIKNVVAVSGTALTEDQVLLLSRYTKNVVLLFDADTAGIKASMRSIELLLKKEFEIKIASLPAGEDPDSFVNKFGKEKFEGFINRAQNFLEYQTAFYDSQGMFNDPATMTEAIRELVKPVALISDELKRSLLIKSISKKFNLREKLIEAELDRVLLQRRTQLTAEVRRAEQTHKQEEQLKFTPDKIGVNPILYNLEKEIIKLLFEGSEETSELIFSNLSDEDFIISIHQKIFLTALQNYQESKVLSIAAIIQKFEDEDIQNYLHELSFEKYSISTNWKEIKPTESSEIVYKKLAKDCIIKLKELKIDQEINQNIIEQENADTEERLLELMKEKRELEKKKKYIREDIEEQ